MDSSDIARLASHLEGDGADVQATLEALSTYSKPVCQRFESLVAQIAAARAESRDIGATSTMTEDDTLHSELRHDNFVAQRPGPQFASPWRSRATKVGRPKH